MHLNIAFLLICCSKCVDEGVAEMVSMCVLFCVADFVKRDRRISREVCFEVISDSWAELLFIGVC